MVVGLLLLGLPLGWLGYRLFGPLRIFSVSEGFSHPIVPGPYSEGLATWSQSLCRACHPEIAQEWETSLHANAWHDPAFQGYWKHDERPQICLNCHTPLEDQQPDLVLGFRDSRGMAPILAPNTEYSEGLRNEGVTCAVCHVQNGVIVGPYADSTAPHPVRQDASFLDGGGVCRRCHEVEGKDPGMFYIGPPCGTYAEIPSGSPEGYGCIQCHMPSVDRVVGAGGPVRPSRHHLWKGGHDAETIRQAVSIELKDRSRFKGQKGMVDVELTLSNVGAGHTFPTGDPDRFVTVTFTLRNATDGSLVKTQTHTLKRWILWRPVILELRDNRLHRGEERTYPFSEKVSGGPGSYQLEVEVAYHIMTEKARDKIGYPADLPIRHTLYSARLVPTS